MVEGSCECGRLAVEAVFRLLFKRKYGFWWTSCRRRTSISLSSFREQWLDHRFDEFVQYGCTFLHSYVKWVHCLVTFDSRIDLLG